MLAKYRNTDGDSTDEAKAKRWAERGGAVVDQALARWPEDQ